MTSTMLWGVKESFRRYVRSAGGGTITATAGAEELEDGSFAFAGEQDGDGRHLRFTGDLRFTAHGGMLFVMIVDPWIVENASGWELSVVDLGHWPMRSHRMVFATLGEPATTESGLQFADVTLTGDAALDFGGQYPPGTPLDPIRLVLDTV